MTPILLSPKLLMGARSTETGTSPCPATVQVILGVIGLIGRRKRPAVRNVHLRTGWFPMNSSGPGSSPGADHAFGRSERVSYEPEQVERRLASQTRERERITPSRGGLLAGM